MKIKCNSQQIAKDIYGSITSLDRSIHLEEWEIMLDEKYKSNSKYNKEYDQGNDKEFIGRRKNKLASERKKRNARFADEYI
ncbi:hypothetical protein [Acinetobacter sp.]|uniref:hypothetical protein n=1 Tax=Acinetobacter sp. TaxID=472 RepID=UPI002FD9D2C1